MWMLILDAARLMGTLTARVFVPVAARFPTSEVEISQKQALHMDSEAATPKGEETLP